ncbi:MAG: DNA internalization-related competence protein ComEC/Rec2 [Archangium sp.]
MGWSWWSVGNRPAVFPVVSVVAGVVGGPLLALPWWLWAAAAISCLSLSFWRGRALGGVLLGLAGAAFVGAGLAELHCDVVTPRIGEMSRFDAEVERVTTHGLWAHVSSVEGMPTRFRAAFSVEGENALLPGQRFRGVTTFKWVQPASNPGEWSRSVWAWRRGQPVSAHVRGESLVPLSAAPAWRQWLQTRHDELSRDTFAVAGSSREAAALLLTLSAGERAELGDVLEDTFAKSGLAHVLSVSGLHVAALAFALFAALRWLLSRRNWFRRGDPRAWAAPLALPLVWAYVLFTGWQAPAVRSGLMCSLVLGAWILRRRSDALNAVFIALLGMVAVDPASPFDLSVQLSFVAVLSLVLLAPSIRAAIPVSTPSPATQSGWALRWRRWREAAVQTFAASVAVTLTSAPIIAAAFQRVSFAGLVSNVVTLPMSGLLTLIAAGGAAVHLISPWLSTPLLWLGVQLSRAFIAIAEFFGDLPFATGTLAAPSTVLLVLWWSGLAALVLLRGRLRWISLVAPVALLIHLAGPRQQPLTVTFLSVGHGDAIVVSSAGKHALIDAGGVPNGSDPGRRVVLPFLRQQRIESFELVALSHAHPDHGLGLITVLDEVPTKRLWIHANSEEGELMDALLAAAEGALVEERAAGSEVFHLGDATIEVLGPPSDMRALVDENDRSLVLLLRHGEVTFLLTGDIEEAGEALLNVGPVTVMKAPHHGSDTSSTPAFVNATRPRHVVFCVGRDNRFDFPRADVVRRWEAAGAECHRTDLDGAITFSSDGRDVTVETFLENERLTAR